MHPCQHQMAGIALTRKVHQGLGHLGAGNGGRFRPQTRGQRQSPEHGFLGRTGPMLALGRIHIDHHPVGLQPSRQSCHLAHQGIVAGAPAHAHQQALARRPDIVDGTLTAIVAHVLIDPVCRAAQGQLAQRQQIALAEEIARGPFGLLQRIDLARLEALEQLLGGDVDHDDLVGIVKQMVGHGLVDLYAHDAAHHIVEAFQMLDVERGPHLDSRFQQLLHILPALGMARAAHIAVCQLVEQQHFRAPRQCRIQIELVQLPALVDQLTPRQQLQVMQLLLGLGAAVSFHQPHQHAAPSLALALRGRQHGIGLAHPGVGAEVDAQLATMGALAVGLQLGEQCVGIGARRGGGVGG